MLDRKDLRGMIKAIRNGKAYLVRLDHDYGRKNSVFVPFLLCNMLPQRLVVLIY